MMRSFVRLFDEAPTTFEMGVVLYIIYSLLLFYASLKKNAGKRPYELVRINPGYTVKKLGSMFSDNFFYATFASRFYNGEELYNC